MTLMHMVLRWAHISMGLVGILSGAAALTFRKGSRPHEMVGHVFFVSMLIMASMGATLAMTYSPNRGNVMGGGLTFYMVATAWATVRRKPGETGRLEIALALLGLAVGTAGYTFGTMAAISPTNTLDKYPPPLYFIFGSVALLLAAFDVRMIARGGVLGAARLTRHLLRMCLAMFMATASLFLENLWNETMEKYLGIEVPDDAHGVLQDVHWSRGGFGYFPTYSLGNVYSVQIWERLRGEVDDVDEQIARGEFGEIREWLRENLHRHGRKYLPAETLERAVGATIDPEPYLRYLQGKLAAA